MLTNVYKGQASFLLNWEAAWIIFKERKVKNKLIFLLDINMSPFVI